MSGDEGSGGGPSNVPELESLEQKTTMLKYCGRAKPHNRDFRLVLKSRQIVWDSPNKSASKSVVNVDDIHEIREGFKTKRFTKHAKNPTEDDEKKAFSIVYGGSRATLDVVASSAEEKEKWVAALKHLMNEAGKRDKIDLFLNKAWRKADKNGDGELDMDEITKLLKSLNVNLNKKAIKRKFTDASGGAKVLTFEQFTKFYKDLIYREEIEELFKQYAKSTPGFMTVAEFVEFLNEEQKEDVQEEKGKEIFAKYATDEFSSEDKLSLDGFSKYLHGEDGYAFNYEHLKIYQDMDQPMSYYWINSSHNTYLLEDQLRGPSSTEAYVRALRQGCRCVELDCWDGPNNDPIIFHGHTLTSKIKFKDVIDACKEHSFATSEYPVILSIENHCSVEQQTVMANILKEKLGDMLWTTELPDDAEFLPSPSSLKNKIFLKGKTLPKDVKTDDYETGSDDDDEDDVPEEVKEMKAKEGKKKGAKVKVSRELSDLIVYCKTAKFKSLEDSVQNGHPAYMSSFGEKKSEKFAAEQRENYIKYNRRQFSRIYPAGGRVDSSNYDPRVHWNSGCQIVALNYQTLDKPMQWNLGKYRENGGAGYLLKPEWMNKDDAPRMPPRTIKIKIISAQQLPKPSQQTKGEVIDPYVKLEVGGEDSDVKEFKTKTIDDNGFNPVWNEEFEFKVTTPEITLLRFAVYDKDVDSDDFIAVGVLPVTSLKPGYRHVQLFDSKNTLLPLSGVFIQTMMTTTEN